MLFRSQDVLRYQADYEKAASEISVAKLQRNIGQVKSAQRAQTAASGFAQAGTPQELEIDTDIQGEIDIAILRSAGGIEQLRLQNAGTMARAQGYGVAAGLYQRGFGSILNTSMVAGGARSGWFDSTGRTSKMWTGE